MIVVVGVPAWRAADPAAPAGRACDVARAAAQRGARVELVGRVGDDPAGDALLLALTRSGVGHVAVLRDPARATPIMEPAAPDEETELSADAGGDGTTQAARIEAATAPRLEAADVSLGLQYLTTFGVLVVTDDVPTTVLSAATDAAGFAGAHLVLLMPPGGEAPSAMPERTTVLAAPEEADEGAFATLVGAYAAALDAGTAPADAFAAATSEVGSEAIRA